MRKKIITLIIVIIVGAGAFYGGMRYGQSQGATSSLASQSSALGQGRQRIAGGNGAGAGNFTGTNSAGFVSGQIIAKDDKSITIKLRDGGSKIVFYSVSTQVNKMASGTVNDLTVGEQVTANGQANSDGSVSAQMIQLRPELPQASGQPSPRPSNQ